MKRHIIPWLFWPCFLLNSALYAQDTTWFFISPQGNDNQKGSQEEPLASVQAAFSKLQTHARGAHEVIMIELADGVYPTTSLVVSPRINGAMDAKIWIRAANPGKAVLHAGKALSLEAFSPATETAFSTRVQPRLRDSLVVIKLSDLGIRNIRQYADLFDGNGGLVQLFFDERRMPLSRYPNPNEGNMTMKEVLVNGGGQEKPGSWSDFYKDSEVRRQLEINPPRPGRFVYQAEHQAAHARWSRALEQGIPVWANGFWRVMWENSTIRIGEIDLDSSIVSLAVPIRDGIGSKYHRPGGSGQEVYKIVNLLEEIDQPGEWSVDFASQQLFFYPPKQTGRVSIAHSLDPVIELKYLSDVTLEGLVIEGGLGDGIVLTGGRNNRILGCTVRRMGNDGIVIRGGFSHEVRSCDLYDLGGGGVWLSGGMEDTKPRVAAQHQVINNHIHHFAQVRRVYAAGINCGFTGGGGGGHYPAVGNRIAHNLIHTTPHVGILHGSFDNVFEYNEVYNWSTISNDMGAIYCYSHYPYIDGTVVRYNFFHSSAQGDGLYFDHNMAGAEVYGNLLFNLGNPDDAHGRGTAFLIKNGDKDQNHDRIRMYNNLALETKFAFYARLTAEEDFFHNIAINSQASDFALFFHETVGAEPVKNPAFLFLRNKAYQGDVGFSDYPNLDLSLEEGGLLLRDFPDFKPLPFGQMGLFEDAYRLKVKNEHRNLSYLKDLTKGAGAYQVEDRE